MSLLVRYTVNKFFKATQENFVVAVCVTWEVGFKHFNFPMFINLSWQPPPSVSKSFFFERLCNPLHFIQIKVSEMSVLEVFKH